MKEIAVQTLVPVRPIFIVGANVNGKPNFLEIGGGGSVSANPPMMAIPIQHVRHTLKGIMEHKTFSVCVPSTDQFKEADYTGIVSGAQTDKAKDCGFKVFYGKLGNAPMIEQCPVNMECTVVHIIGTTSHAIVIGRVDGAYVADEYFVNGKMSFDKFNPLLWFVDKGDYVGPGAFAGKVRSSGNQIKQKK